MFNLDLTSNSTLTLCSPITTTTNNNNNNNKCHNLDQLEHKLNKLINHFKKILNSNSTAIFYVRDSTSSISIIKNSSLQIKLQVCGVFFCFV